MEYPPISIDTDFPEDWHDPVDSRSNLDDYIMEMIMATERRFEQGYTPEPEVPRENLTITTDCPELALQIEHSPLRSAWICDSISYDSGSDEYILYEGPAVNTIIRLKGVSACQEPQLFLRIDGEYIRGVFCGDAFSIAVGETYVYDVPVLDAMESFSITLTSVLRSKSHEQEC